MTETEKEKPGALRVALIGLIGTLLTVCGGLMGALISASVTVWQVERQARQVALAPPGSTRALDFNMGETTIRYEDAMRLDPSQYYVAPELGFVLAQPREGWGPVEEMTYRDLFVERGAWTGSSWDDQPVHRIRYQEPVSVQYMAGSELNGIAVDPEALRKLYGTDTFRLSTEVTVLTVNKQAAAGYRSLAAVALDWGAIHRSGANRIVADKEGTYVLMQTSWQARSVRVDGRDGPFVLERWALFAEGPRHYYVVEAAYIPRSDQSVQVWEDLQAYMASFRVIR